MLFNLPPATRAIIVANVLLFALEWLTGASGSGAPLLNSPAAANVLASMALWPPGPLFHPWQLVTYAFLHGGWQHIFFNMFAVWMFGTQLERFWGTRRYVIFYFASVVAAGIAQLVVTGLLHQQYPTVGASGGIFGLLLGFAMFFPRQKVIFMLLPIPMPAWLFVTLYGALELYLGVTGTEAGVAHFAHLGGMLGGWLTILSWRRRPTAV